MREKEYCMDKIITVEQLYKKYGDLQAVNGISFYVERGKLFAFLGPNGAGKSTTIDILCTLLKPDQGEVTIDGLRLGQDNDAIRRLIGVVFQESLLDPQLSVLENLQTRGRFYGLNGPALNTAVEQALTVVEAHEFAKQLYGNLSGGQRRRADIARALIHTPKILFLDEPTTGLDPKTKESVWQTIEKLQKQSGMTVFLTTHYMEEAAKADYIVLIQKGEIAAKGTPYDLKERFSSDTMRLKARNPKIIEKILVENHFTYEIKNGLYIVPLSDTLLAIPVIQAMQADLESFEVVHGSMEDVFLNIIGGEWDHV
jgi:multidrug/hemolysin transport system ATP-binding protein